MRLTVGQGVAAVGLLPLSAGAGLLCGRPRPQRAFRMALGVALATLALALAVAAQVRSADVLVRDGLCPWFGVDALSAPLLVFEATLLVVLVAGEPRKTGSPAVLGALLASGGGTILLFSSQALPLVAAAWALSFAPLLALPRSCAARPLLLAGGLSSALIGAGALVAAVSAEPGGPGLFAGVPAPARGAAFGLVVAALLVRGGAIPWQVWISGGFARGSLACVLLVVASRADVYVLLRLQSAAPAEARLVEGALTALGVGTMLYGSLLGLARSELRACAGALCISHGGLVLVGAGAAAEGARAGALVLCWGGGLALTGLTLVSVAVEARFGEQAAKERGVGQGLPALGAFYLLCGACCVGFPGSLGFVGEELLIHGLEDRPWGVAGLLLGTTLNGIVVLRTYLEVFLGPLHPDRPRPPGIRPRERLVLLTVGAALIGWGVCPAFLIRVAAQAVGLGS